ncbi:MAG: hypothetical protein R3F45_03880 [Gammaproteobacteria bacterium]
MATRTRAKAAEDVQPVAPQIGDALRKQTELRQLLSDLRSEHERAVLHAEAARRAHQDAALQLQDSRRRLEEASERYGAGAGGEPSPSQQREIADLESIVARIRSEADAAEQRMRALAEQIAAIERSLLEAPPLCGLAHIEAHANAMRQAQAEIDRISAVIERAPLTAEREAELHREIERLNTRREDLRAAAAIGEDTSEQIEETNAAIANAETALQALWADVTNAEEAAAGLQRRLAQAQTTLDNLASNTRPLCHAYLVTMVEHERARYLESTADLIRSALRLIGIQGALQRYAAAGDLSELFPRGYIGLAIPTLWDTSGVEMPIPRERDGFIFSIEKAEIYGDFNARSLVDDVLDQLRPLLADTPSQLAARR